MGRSWGKDSNAIDKHQFRRLQERAAHGKYKRLFMTLLVRRSGEWRATLEDVEGLLTFDLPKSARRYSAWWANDESHSQALAWIGAGWKTSDVDLESETITFTPKNSEPVDRSLFDLNVVLPVHRIDAWPEGLSLRREDIYEDWSSKTFAQDVRLRQAAAASKYSRLFIHLVDRNDYKWRTTFEDVEEVLEFDLPESARNHRPWWANDESHTHALAWIAAGWKTAEVDLAAKTLTFERPKPARIPRAKRTKINLDKEFPVHHAKLLRKDATFSREEIYEDRI